MRQFTQSVQDQPTEEQPSQQPAQRASSGQPGTTAPGSPAQRPVPGGTSAGRRPAGGSGSAGQATQSDHTSGPQAPANRVDAMPFPLAEPLDVGLLLPAILTGTVGIGGSLLLTVFRRRNRQA